jgi:hypothetical protein
MTHEDAEGFLARNFNDRRQNAPVSQESGLPLHEELKEAGFLSGEDAENFALHYGLGPEHELKRNYTTGGHDVFLKNADEDKMCKNCDRWYAEPGHDLCEDCQEDPSTFGTSEYTGQDSLEARAYKAHNDPDNNFGRDEEYRSPY